MTYKFQKTIKQNIYAGGIGLHSGKKITVTLKPKPSFHGLSFKRTDVKGSLIFKASAESVKSTNLATSIGNGGGAISTVEHLLAALSGLGISNIAVEVNGPELPIFDGSAAVWVQLLKSAGIVELDSLTPFYKVKKAFSYIEGDKLIKVKPASIFSVESSIDFGGVIGSSSYEFTLSAKDFEKEIAPARTFCYLKDVEYMQANGLALGGSLANAVVVGDDCVLNEEGLRFPDEFVRHKILDFLGDLSLSQYPIIGKFTTVKTGHDLNQKFLKSILKRNDVLEFVDPNKDYNYSGFSNFDSTVLALTA